MKQQNTKKQNHVFCPVCGRGKIIMEDESAKDISLLLVLPGSKKQARWHIKCNVCKSQIGITTKIEF